MTVATTNIAIGWPRSPRLPMAIFVLINWVFLHSQDAVLKMSKKKPIKSLVKMKAVQMLFFLFSNNKINDKQCYFIQFFINFFFQHFGLF